MSVGVILHELDDDQRRAAYGCDITYGTNNEYGFDYLRDNMKYSTAEMVQFGGRDPDIPAMRMASSTKWTRSSSTKRAPR